MDAPPDVSFVVPARNEADYLPACLEGIAALETDYAYETIVVDGASTDDTAAVARAHGTTVLEGTGSSIAAGRNRGGREASGEWLAFIDADTRVRPNYLTEMLGFVERENLAAASSACRITGPLRAKLVEGTINHVFPCLDRPVLPGFNFFVRREAFLETGGFPEVPNEDTAFSRALGCQLPTGYHDAVLVESSGRRIADAGLTGTLVHYLSLDAERFRASV